jgi:hypothetical protein
LVARIFLAIVGVLYVVLAGWCAVAPGTTSKAVGFTLLPGSGQSEYLTVYGGLDLALGLIFLWPLYRPGDAPCLLLVCLVVHGCLVLFRTAGFFLYSGFETTTYVVAALEWIIFLAAAGLSWRAA